MELEKAIFTFFSRLAILLLQVSGLCYLSPTSLTILLLIISFLRLIGLLVTSVSSHIPHAYLSK